jgi:acyl-CoA synthetase (AMP-forming)/AMP-acid ligase II
MSPSGRVPRPTIPLSYALPGAVAAISYLDARFHLRHDLRMLFHAFGSQIGGAMIEKRDTCNCFYVLENKAQNPKTSNRPFLIFAGKTHTYRDAYENALRYGTWLKNRYAVRSGEVVAMDFMNSDTFLWIWFGLWAIGAKPAFINYNLMDKALLHSLKTSGTRLLLVDEEVFAGLDEQTKSAFADEGFRDEGGGVQAVPFTPAVMADIEQTLGKREPNGERSGQMLKDMAILIYTSGTTGLPKPAVVSWAKAGISSNFGRKWLGLRSDDIFYTCMPLYHSSAAILGVMTVLNAGAALSLGRKFQRQQFWEDCRSTNATVIQYVGETCRYLMSAPPSPLDKQHNVRMAFGNGLRPDIWALFKERFGIETVAEFYAATEGPSGLFNLNRNAYSEGSVGWGGLITRLLLRGSSIIVEMDFDENKPIRDANTGFCKVVEPGEPGELLFKLADLETQFQGYYRNKKATSSKIMTDVLEKGDAYFSTGDVLRRDSEGRFYFCDRIGDTYRWKSENVSTAEVSEVVGQKREYFDEANVYGVEIPSHDGRAGCAAVLLSPDQQARFLSSGDVDSQLLEDVARHSLKNLPRYAVPIFLRVLKDESVVQRTGTNKQQKHVLRNEGVDPSVVEGKGDRVYWLKPGEKSYRPFGAEEWKSLNAGQVKL